MPIKAILFDFMGTCLDWHTSITSSLPTQILSPQRSAFALAWRQTYFDLNAARQNSGLPVEDIDITHRKALDTLLATQEFSHLASFFTDDVKTHCIAAWHTQQAWPDVAPALTALRARGWEIFVHANGSTRLQLDLCRSSGLRFDMLFSSSLLGFIKPDPRNYTRCLELLGLKAEECVLVAAHAYDTRGAKAVGMKTVYVWRWTDDVHEDQEVVKGENDAWVEGMAKLEDVIGGLE